MVYKFGKIKGTELEKFMIPSRPQNGAKIEI
jgi:hypothetical protein